MDLPKNALKSALKAGQRQIGLWVSDASPDAAELLATCGYDWLLFDLEHTTNSLADAAGLLRAVSAYPVSGVVRPGWNDPVEIKRLLDAGTQSLIVPYVQSAAEAEAAVASVRYPPRGRRGFAGMTRATRYGAVAEYAADAADEICLIVQIESEKALGAIEEIAAVDGIDAIFVGPADLAASLGHPGEIGHAAVRPRILEAIRRIVAAGRPAGLLALDEDLLHDAEAAGAIFLGIDVDAAILRRGALARRADWT